MKTFLTKIKNRGKKLKYWKLNLNIALRLDKLNAESFTILAVNKIGFYFQTILLQVIQS